MQAMISKQIWTEFCEGYSFKDCAIHGENKIYLLAEEDRKHEEQIAKMRVLILAQVNEKIEYGYVNFDESFWATIGISEQPLKQGVIIQVLGGSVVPVGGGRSVWPTESIKRDEMCVITKSKNIGGYIWATGSKREIFKRTGIDQWIAVDAGLVKNPSSPHHDEVGFLGIDGFSQNDIYAVGGLGDIWHYDGTLWHQCGFPTNDKLTAVCCAEEGVVYVASRYKLWKGRLNQWEAVHELSLANYIHDLCWFDNRLWGCGPFDFFCWDGKTLEENVTSQDSELTLMGSMDCSAGFLLVAGSKSVWTFDGRQWHTIVPGRM